jgi:hypothetical protein
MHHGNDFDSFCACPVDQPVWKLLNATLADARFDLNRELREPVNSFLRSPNRLNEVTPKS